MMNKGNILGVSIALVLAGAAVTATAQTPAKGAPAKGAPAANSIDTDGDGRVSKAEQAAMSRNSFNRLDANKDGKLTAAELSTVRDAARGQAAEREFAAIDTDRNGAISKAEFMAFANKGAKPIETLGTMDANKDGGITLAEFSAPSAAAFDRADANKDGFVTAQERQAAAQAAQAARGAARPAAKK